MSRHDPSQVLDRDHIKHLSEEARDALNADPITGEAGSHPISTGLGATGGAVTGAALGAVGGPLGVLVGGAVGAVVGGLAGKAAGEAVEPTHPDVYWQELLHPSSEEDAAEPPADRD